MIQTVGVVPIFVNAGAAVLPAVLGALASAAALLLKPRELIAVFRRRPWVPAVVLLAIGAIWGATWLIVSAPQASAGRASGAPTAASAGLSAARVDWTQVALDIISRQQGGDHLMRPLWQHKEEDTVFLSSPVVRDGRVYAASCEFGVTGTSGSVFCFDAESGAVIWQTSGKSADDHFHAFFSSPALSTDGKYLVIGQGLHEDADCELLCLDTAAGRLHWTVKTPLHIESSPAIHGDMAVAGAGAIEGDDHKATGHPGMVVAVRVSDGTELWRAQVNDPESSPAISEDGTVYIGSGFNGNAVVALRSESDDELRRLKLDRFLWRAPAPYPVTSKVVLAGDVVLVGGGNSDYVYSDPSPAGIVLALDRRTGQVRWQTPMPDAVLGAIAVRDGRVICPVHNGEVVALDLKDGRRIWSQQVNRKSAVLSGATLAGPYALAVSRDGLLGFIRASDGQISDELKFELNENGKPGEKGLCLSTPTVAGGRVYVGTETGGLRCFALRRDAP